MVSQFLTLYTVPVVYLAFDRLAFRLRGLRVGNRDRRRGAGGGVDHEHLDAVHQAACRDFAAHAGSRAGRSSGILFSACRAVPQVEYPDDNVNANLPGASPDTMARPSRLRWNGVRANRRHHGNDVQQQHWAMRNIAMQFDLNRNIDAAARDVQAAINAARGQLPANAEQSQIPEGQSVRLSRS